jgi:hypothetical protein
MLEVEKSFRRLKAHKQLPFCESHCCAISGRSVSNPLLAKTWRHRIQAMTPASPILTSTGTIPSDNLY